MLYFSDKRQVVQNYGNVLVGCTHAFRIRLITDSLIQSKGQHFVSLKGCLSLRNKKDTFLELIVSLPFKLELLNSISN
jgi:hypothetical protein